MVKNLLSFSLMISLLLLTDGSFAQNYPEDSPEFGAEQFLIGALTNDGILLGRYICNYDAQLMSGDLMNSMINQLTIERYLQADVTLQVDLLDTNFIIISQDTQWAVVQITGEVRVALGGAFESYPADGVLHLLYENARWRVCEEFWKTEVPSVLSPNQIELISSIDGSWEWTPDGQKLVHQIYGDNGYTLYVTDIDGNNTLQLAQSIRESQISPDGQKFVYKGDNGIYITDIGGSNTVLIAQGIERGYRYKFRWSPDGQKIAYSNEGASGMNVHFALDYGQSLAYTRQSNDVDTLYIANIDGSNTWQVAQNVSDWYWSSDGQKMAYMVNNRDGTEILYTVNADGSNNLQLDQIVFSVNWWSPLGQQLGYQKLDDDGSLTLYVANADGSNIWRFAQNVGNWQWSPTGQQIAYTTYSDNIITLYVANTDGSNAVQVEQIVDIYYIRWSPDGQKIAYVAENENGEVIFNILNADGSNIWQVAQNVSDWEWSPNGQKMAYVADSGDDELFYIVNADGSNLIQIAGYVDWWEWSPNGQKMAYVADSEDDELFYVVNADGSNPLFITKNLYRGSWSPNSQYFAYTVSLDGSPLYLVNIGQ